ncbi:MAG: hypothetical protein NTX35_07840 [Verrucomicrobia bacterium]|nr:hypothetical protein [Verrucomicrobiota bacterium]
MSWVLHRSPESGAIAAKVLRGGKETDLTLDRPAAWPLKSDIGKRVGTWPMRAMACGGMKTGDIPTKKLTAIVQRSGKRVELKLPQQ